MRKIIIILISILCYPTQIFAQDNSKDSLVCKSYYDNILQKEIYSIVEISPSFEKGINYFYELLFQKLNDSQIKISKRDVVFNEKIILSIIIDENGKIDKIKIIGKDSSEYSKLDKAILHILEELKTEKWLPGICEDNKVTSILYIPIIIGFN